MLAATDEVKLTPTRFAAMDTRFSMLPITSVVELTPEIADKIFLSLETKTPEVLLWPATIDNKYLEMTEDMVEVALSHANDDNKDRFNVDDMSEVPLAAEI